jgi:hypothetical protein
MSRLKYTYPIPVDCRIDNWPQKVTLVQLTGDEELQSTRRARGDAAQMVYELVRESIRAVDGVPCSMADEDNNTETVWKKMHPKARSLCVQAYGKLHNPKDEDVRSFLDGEEVSTDGN